MSDDRDPLSQSTLRVEAPSNDGARARVLCATLLCHPDLSRVGERAVLTGALVGTPMTLGRGEPLFGAPRRTPRPIEDQYVSRRSVRMIGQRRGKVLQLTQPADGVLCDGTAFESRELTEATLDAGVILELGGRVALLLHRSENLEETPMEGLVGNSDAIERVRREIARVADLDVSVLIVGETGSGKEQVAQAIHARSPRCGREMVSLNMATLPESMAASVLFGHAKGAFTGAQKRHEGLLERASGSTLFLDELGDTPPVVQPMLLRAIETRRILPLGAEAERAVDLRIVAATETDLASDASEGTFRAALLHRLAGYEISVPPLRERADDVARLFVHFLRREAEKVGQTAWFAPRRDGSALVPPSLVRRLVRQSWPGNVRQLANIVRQLVISNRGESHLRITPAVERQLGAGAADEFGEPPAPSAAASSAASRISDERLLYALEENRWSPGRTAAALGIPTSTLHDLMRRCPGVRRAADVPDAELRAALSELGDDLPAAAERLKVSVRALKLRLRTRGSE